MVPTRTGYKFLGWATSQSSTAQQYVAGQLYKGQNIAPSSITLYAVWAKDSEVQNNK